MIIDRIKCLDVFYKKSVLKNLKNSKENTCTAIFLIKFSKKYRNFRVKGFGGVPFKVIASLYLVMLLKQNPNTGWEIRLRNSRSPLENCESKLPFF